MREALRFFLGFAVLTLVLSLAGCGAAGGSKSSGTQPSGPGSTAPSAVVTGFLIDGPASTGATGNASVADVAAFAIDVTGATLTGSGSTIVLSSSVQTLEIRHLDLASTFLLQASAGAPQNFTTLNLTLANPQITALNAQGQPAHLDGTTTPSVRLAQAQVNVPVTGTLLADGQLGLSISFDLLRSVSIDSNGNYLVTPVVSATVVPGTPQGNQLEEAVGTIESVAGSAQQSLTVQLPGGNQTISLLVDGSTLLGSGIGQFSNLQSGQNITFDAQFQSNGGYMATFIGSAAPNLAMSYEGVLASIGQDSSGNPTISLVAQD